MKNLFYFIFFCLTVTQSVAQITNPTLITPLPSVLMESSGIEVNNSNSVWTHNDSGDSARIFNIDTAGNILRIVHLNVDTAFDCEESTQDQYGNYYMGDFGNNLNDRTNLRIYKIPNPDSLPTDTVTPQIIYFSFPDQILFPPPTSEQNFDCEAMFHWGDSLYLFSKNRGTSTWSKMYRLPDVPGTYVAELVDSFNTGTWITSADISPSGQTMVLLSETRIWVFTNYTIGRFFDGDARNLTMDYSQKEAIVFVNDSVVYITDEYFLNLGGNLYSFDLSSWINGIDDNVQNSHAIDIYPQPAINELNINFKFPSNSYSVEILCISGSKLMDYQNTSTLDISSLESGFYILRIESEDCIASAMFLKM